MLKLNKKRLIAFVLVFSLLSTTEFNIVNAGTQAKESNTIFYEQRFESPIAAIWAEIPEMALIAEKTQNWYKKALANTDSTVDVHIEPNGTVVGILYQNTVVDVLEEDEGWVKISSGQVQGYVKREDLLFGYAAVEKAEMVCANGTQEAKTLQQIEEEQRKIEEEQRRERERQEAEAKRAQQEKLLAALIYCEAGNQSYEGKVAVGAVVMNRIKSARFPNTLEEVIYQPGQFTPALSGKLERVMNSGQIPSSCYEAARAALNGANPVGNALFFNGSYGSFKLGDHYFS